MPVIKVESLSKKYSINHLKQERYTALRDVITNNVKKIGERILHPFTNSNQKLSDYEALEDFWALKDVSFEIKQGDRVGIIGRNGAGKSTLLKVLSRITEPTSGRIEIAGRVASLLEVGTGFHPELTGRENIFLNGAILGMGKAEIKRKFDEIVDFAEVEKFLDTPVKRYSSGMYVRLAFAVAAHLEPEILVVDEVLAVGDVQFQKKCLGKMEDVGKEGRTVLFVSHNMQAIKSLCKTAVLLEKGRMLCVGSTTEAINTYINDETRNENKKIECVFSNHEPMYSEVVKIYRWYVQDDTGNIPNGELYNDKKYEVVIEAELFKIEPNMVFFVSYYAEDDTLLFVSDIHDSGVFDVRKLGLGKIRVTNTVPVDLFLTRNYKIEVSCVIHCQGWPLIPARDKRIQFEFKRLININKMGYDEIGHPFNGAPKPGFVNPILKWEVANIFE